MTLTGRVPGESPGDWVARVDAAAERFETPCGGGRMVWRSWGRGEPVVLLHGGSGSWLHWIRNLPALAVRYRVIAPDTPGLGDSAPPPRPFDPQRLHESMTALAEITCRELAEVVPGPARYHLVDFSMGAILGGFVAVSEPHRVRRLVLVGASALGPPWPGLPGSPRAPDPDAGDAERRAAHVHNLGLILLGDAANADETAVDLHERNMRRARVRAHALARSDLLGRILHAIEPPIGAIWGERDVYVAPDVAQSARVLAERDPQAPLHVIPGAGHWVMYEAAAAFDRALLEVLAAGD